MRDLSRQKRHQKQSGFTLIELVIVIVIIGILAAVAIPKFLDLKSDAQKAALNGIAGNLASASASNYAIRSGGSTLTAYTTTSAVTDCTSIGGLLQGGLPTGFTIAGSLPSCTVSGAGATGTVPFIGQAA